MRTAMLLALMALPTLAAARTYDLSDSLAQTNTIFLYAGTQPPHLITTRIELPVTGFAQVQSNQPRSFEPPAPGPFDTAGGACEGLDCTFDRLVGGPKISSAGAAAVVTLLAGLLFVLKDQRRRYY